MRSWQWTACLVCPADVHCFWDLVEAASDADNDVELDTQSDVPVLRFTGGTTGRGKCAMYTIDNWAALRDSAYIQPDFEFNEQTRYLALTPLSHAGLISVPARLLYRRSDLHAEQP